MFQKKQYIYSETQGVCQVDNIVSLKTKRRAPMQYYVLKSVYEPQTISYIPVEGHKVELLTWKPAFKNLTIAEWKNIGKWTMISSIFIYIIAVIGLFID